MWTYIASPVFLDASIFPSRIGSKFNFYFLGYLSEDDIKHVCTSYSTAYQMNISKTHIYEAMNNARSMDPGTDLINIGLFCRFLDDVLFKQ